MQEIWSELRARGLLAEGPEPVALRGGNRDRESAITTWRAIDQDGRALRISVGMDLAQRAERQREFARVCGGLVPPVIFLIRAGNHDVMGEEFLPGQPLETVLADPGAISDRIVPAFAQVCSLLAGTARTSTEPDRAMEWKRWCDQLLALAVWTEPEKVLLRETVLPALRDRLTHRPPETRWTNGDFSTENLLFDSAAGALRLVDHEYAEATHFHAVESVRFHVLSPAARRHPQLFKDALPDPGPAWHLFFWLQQVQREVRSNRPAYLTAVLERRRMVIRRLAEQVLGLDMSGWSTAAFPLEYNLEQARWTPLSATALHFSGWCHVKSSEAARAFTVHDDSSLLGEAAPRTRPDVQAHFGGEPAALLSGFDLRLPPPPDRDTRLLLSIHLGDGTLLPFHTMQAGDLPGRGPVIGDYAAWSVHTDPTPPAPPRPATDRPFFSIVLPVFRPPLRFLEECVLSVRAQHHVRWELVMVDDGSESETITASLRRFAAADPRMVLRERNHNGGIAQATNDALRAARGDFVVLLDHDDLLRPHALAEFARHIADDPAADVLYSDEDKITADGQPALPVIKPDFSPELLLGVMYVGHALCVRRTLAQSVRFDSRFDGIQDYEFFLRLTEATTRIRHVPRILYRWRMSGASSAMQGNVKGNMDAKQVEAVQEHLRRRGRAGKVVALGAHRVRLELPGVADCEVIHGPTETDPLRILRNAAEKSRARVLLWVTPGPLTTSSRWQEILAGVAALPDSALVAPLLLSSEGRVLASGATFAHRRIVPIMAGLEANGDGYNGSLVCTREVAAVLPWCFAVRRDVVLEHGKSTEWGPWCVELRARGLFHRVCPAARLQLPLSWRIPPPSISIPVEGADPFYPAAFSTQPADYALAWKAEARGRQ
jgi:GT2 family glycosyltransferase